MGTTTKRFAVILGLTAAAALTTFAFTKTGKKLRKRISEKATELKNELTASMKERLARTDSSRDSSG